MYVCTENDPQGCGNYASQHNARNHYASILKDFTKCDQYTLIEQSSDWDILIQIMCKIGSLSM